ncbi:MAG: hypothetical protein QF732_02940 [Nitrospinaceae bacterium]|nr:hypothetical protein [Nitrospinaceae bacterium]
MHQRTVSVVEYLGMGRLRAYVPNGDGATVQGSNQWSTPCLHRLSDNVIAVHRQSL